MSWQEKGGDYTGRTFTWDLLAMGGAGDQAGAIDGSTIFPDAAFGSPDGLWVDSDGRLWIETDSTPGAQPGLGGGNNQMLVADLTTRPKAPAGSTNVVPEIRRFLTGPRGCEITGITATPDNRTMFINVQHPGEEAHLFPDRASTWPNLAGVTLPTLGDGRSSTEERRRRERTSESATVGAGGIGVIGRGAP